jgi:hypothetical protein
MLWCAYYCSISINIENTLEIIEIDLENIVISLSCIIGSAGRDIGFKLACLRIDLSIFV